MTALSGKRILIVEDEVLVAMILEDMLRDMGAEVAGPYLKLETALDAAEHETPLDAAVLDVKLGPDMSFEIAECLRRRDIPFVFSTGYESDGGAMAGDATTINKPYARAQLEHALVKLVGTVS